MSRMQEASGRVECTYARLASSIAQEADNQESVGWVPETDGCEARHPGKVSRKSVVWISVHTKSGDRQNGSAKNNRSESRRIAPTGTPVPTGHPHARSRSTVPKVTSPLPVGRSDNDSLEAQIRRFKEREDLRECLLPGMLSGISQRACEGWQRQATARTGRFIAKIKLGPCKNCKYFGEASVKAGAQV